MKTLISDVGQVQSDVLSLWSENARMILEVCPAALVHPKFS